MHSARASLTEGRAEIDAITTYVPFGHRTALRFFRIVKEQTADSRGVTTARREARSRTRDSSMDAGGADRIRTDDPLLAKQMLSQLSYSPEARILRSSSTGAEINDRGGSGWS